MPYGYPSYPRPQMIGIEDPLPQEQEPLIGQDILDEYDAPMPEEEFEASPFERFLENFARSTQGIQMQPKGFGQGLVAGIAQGLGSRGAGVATAREKFDKRREARRMAMDEDRRRATSDVRQARLREEGDVRKGKREGSEGVAIDAAQVARFPQLKDWLGKELPIQVYNRVTTDLPKPPKAEPPFDPQSLTALNTALRTDPDISKGRDIEYGNTLVKTGRKLGTGPGDIMMIFGYMKMLDPGSTVREGEYATAENAAGIPDRIRAAYNKAVAGEKLAPQTRQEYATAAENLYKEVGGRAQKSRDRYRKQSRALGVPENLLFDEDLDASLGKLGY